MLRLLSLLILVISLWTFPNSSISHGSTRHIESFNIEGLIDTVEIRRDAYGTPYILANNEEDLIFAHGYMQAKDRLFQLDGMRRLPQGRISEIVGRDYLSMDTWFRKLGLARVARESLKCIKPDMMESLELFSNGINTYIDTCDVLPIEFTLLGYEPEKWSPYDSICVMNLISWWLSIGMYQEQFYDELVYAFGKDIANPLGVRLTPVAGSVVALIGMIVLSRFPSEEPKKELKKSETEP